MLPLPFMVVMAIRGSVVAIAGPGAPPLRLQEPREVTLALVGGLFPAGFALLTWAPARAIRGLGYLGYSIALALGFSVGVVLAVAGLVSSNAGTLRLDGLAWMLLVGSFVCGACLLPLAYLIVTDWRASRREGDGAYG
jgi:hypothetical protein